MDLKLLKSIPVQHPLKNPPVSSRGFVFYEPPPLIHPPVISSRHGSDSERAFHTSRSKKFDHVSARVFDKNPPKRAPQVVLNEDLTFHPLISEKSRSLALPRILPVWESLHNDSFKIRIGDTSSWDLPEKIASDESNHQISDQISKSIIQKFGNVENFFLQRKLKKLSQQDDPFTFQPTPPLSRPSRRRPNTASCSLDEIPGVKSFCERRLQAEQLSYEGRLHARAKTPTRPQPHPDTMNHGTRIKFERYGRFPTI